MLTQKLKQKTKLLFMLIKYIIILLSILILLNISRINKYKMSGNYLYNKVLYIF